jgi:hypothetical protein
MRNPHPLFCFAGLLFIVGIACGVSGGTDTPVPPTLRPVPTAKPAEAQPTPVSSPTPAPTETPVLQFFREEFDQDPGWNYFLTYGDKSKADVEFTNSLMTFNLTDTDIYAYYLYEDFEYRDVRLDISAENRGKNNNNISLVCRYTEDGWYEFSTEGGGVWYLYAAVPSSGQTKYNIIDNGGALALKQGKEINEYTMICQENEIRLYINDTEIKTITENNYTFGDGYVGFNISSLNVYPIIVEVDWFEISEP